jgi:hypothetical protein
MKVLRKIKHLFLFVVCFSSHDDPGIFFNFPFFGQFYAVAKVADDHLLQHFAKFGY